MATSWRTMAAVAGHPGLVRVLATGGVFVLAEFATWIAVLVYAFEQGGASTAAILAVAQLIPGILVAPLAASLTERRSPITVLSFGFAIQSVMMAATAVVMVAGGPPPAIYVGAVLTATAVTMTRPAATAALPALAGSEVTLTAANVVAGWLEDAATVGAGLLAGVSLISGSPTLVFVTAALCMGGCALAVIHIRIPAVLTARESAGRRCLTTIAEGVATIAIRPQARLLVALLTAMQVVIGALDLLLVIVAVSVLHRGSEWTGYLNAAFGVGGVLAALITVRLPGRRLGKAVMMSAAVAWFGIVTTAFSTEVGLTGSLLMIMGVGCSVLRTSARTLLQRTVPAAQLGTVFGVVEGLAMAGLAVGAGLVPVLAGIGGPTMAVVGIAVVLPVSIVLGGRSLFRLDAAASVPVTEISLLRSVRALREVPTAGIERLAAAAVRREVADGVVIAQRSLPGDVLFLLVRGRLELSTAEPGGLAVATEALLVDPGSHHGTLTARGPVLLLEIDAHLYRATVHGVPAA